MHSRNYFLHTSILIFCAFLLGGAACLLAQTQGDLPAAPSAVIQQKQPVPQPAPTPAQQAPSQSAPPQPAPKTTPNSVEQDSDINLEVPRNPTPAEKPVPAKNTTAGNDATSANTS